MILNGEVGAFYPDNNTRRTFQVGGMFHWSLVSESIVDVDNFETQRQVLCVAESYFLNQAMVTTGWVRLFGKNDTGTMDGIRAEFELRHMPKNKTNKWIQEPIEIYLSNIIYRENAIEKYIMDMV